MEQESIQGPKMRHPKALYMLFLVEMWERFNYYGMRALLTLYLISEASKGGLSWTSSQAGQLYGTFTGLAYVTPLFGGILADRILGYRRAVVIGGLMFAMGQFLLAYGSSINYLPVFYIGLLVIILANGLFKPNVSSMVGQLYEDGSPMKDSAYTIFYMGINMGAFLGALACGFLGENYGWQYGFMAAGFGMLVGQVIFYFGQGLLGNIGLAPKREVIDEIDGNLPLSKEDQEKLIKEGYKVSKPLTMVEYQRLSVVFVLTFFSILFWLAFEQAGSSMNIYAYRYTDRFVTNNLQVDEYSIAMEKSSINDSVILGQVAKIILGSKKGESSQLLSKRIQSTTIQFNAVYETSIPDSLKILDLKNQTSLLDKMANENVPFLYKKNTFNNEDTTLHRLVELPKIFLRANKLYYRRVDSAYSVVLKDYIAYTSSKREKNKITPVMMASIKESPKARLDGKQYKVETLSTNQEGFVVPASWFQSVNAFFIFTLAPLFSFLWLFLERYKLNPNGPIKFALALILLSIGFYALVFASSDIPKGAFTAQVSMIWLVIAYLFHTMGELCLSPVGLSFVNKLSPKSLVGMMFGIWFLASAAGYYIGGIVSGFIDELAKTESLSYFFSLFVTAPLVAAVILLAISPILKRWMHGVR
jgi:proton-dependent oligopeptide transporter, POT family